MFRMREYRGSALSKTIAPRKSAQPNGGLPTTRTLGPVRDLERHLPSDWWRTLFNSLYLKTDGDVVENADNTQREVDLVVQAASLERNDCILDMCCGQGRHVLEFGRRGFRNVVGVDRSRYLVRLARKRAATEGLSVTFHEGDARRFRVKGGPYHCVAILGNSFGYFDQQADDAAVLNNVARVMSPNGVLVLDVTDGAWMREHFEPRSWEWIDQDHFVCRERALSRDQGRLISREVIVHAERGVIADQFYAERLYSSPQLIDLLERTGFRMVRMHGEIEADSDRGQDLGMMAHRLLVTAQAPERPTVKAAPVAKAKTKVTVLMGDSGLPDIVKLGGKYNEQDIETVQRLRRALGELENYEFTYQDNHQTLMKSLMAEPPEFVFNLCDEGFRNNPMHELHVSALLEMLGIPYSGATPACLGLCYDKSIVRAIAEAMDVPVPLESYIGMDDASATLPATFPALVKPACGDGSMGITQRAVVNDTVELLAYIDWIRTQYDKRPILVQEFLNGPEYTVGIIGNPGTSYRVLPILQVDYSGLDPNLPAILSYESKWDPKSPYWTDIRYIRADIDEDTTRKLLDYANAMFERTGCRDYARIDFRVDTGGQIKLLEVNPNPGWCWDGKLAMMAEYDGLRYADLLGLIIDAARERLAAQSSHG
jgi:D-alanine-D-alanine ligase